MTDIPHEYFDGELYVRPYVKDGEGVRYGNAASITVCSAAGHVHDSQLFPGCEGCELEDAKGEIGFYNASDKASGDWDVRETYKNIRGTDYFRPHSSNGMQGNDLLIAFNNRYLIDSLRASTAEYVRIALSTPLTSIR